MNNAVSARPIPDCPITTIDVRFFHKLATLATSGAALTELLNELTAYLNFDAVMMCLPQARPPSMQRTVVVPLRVGNYTFGDLYADVPLEMDSVQAAARLMFFAPVIALCMASKS